LQSLWPALHVYEHFVPLHVAAPLVVSHTSPQPAQLVSALAEDSQPFAFESPAF
jgi:hypothetical protein